MRGCLRTPRIDEKGTGEDSRRLGTESEEGA